jgi:hypothetical protein
MLDGGFDQLLQRRQIHIGEPLDISATPVPIRLY